MEKKNWYNLTTDETVKELKTDLKKGLSDAEVTARREKYGTNELKAKRKKTLIEKFLAQFKDFMIIILIIAAIVSGIVGVQEGEGFTDSIIILIVVVVNAIIGVAQESKAEKSLEALQKMSSHVAKVMRNGKLVVVQSAELVPGDIVIFSGHYAMLTGNGDEIIHSTSTDGIILTSSYQKSGQSVLGIVHVNGVK